MRIQDRIRYKDEFISKVRKLAEKHTDTEIAQMLTREGLKSSKGRVLSASIIKGIRHKYRIPKPELKHPNELTVKEIASKFEVSTGVVYYWIENGYLEARRIQNGYPFWITLDKDKETELRERITGSYKLQKADLQHSERSR